MKVKMIGDGTLAVVNDSYGARLIEQGKAVIPPKAQEKPGKAEKPAKDAPDQKSVKRRK